MMMIMICKLKVCICRTSVARIIKMSYRGPGGGMIPQQFNPAAASFQPQIQPTSHYQQGMHVDVRNMHHPHQQMAAVPMHSPHGHHLVESEYKHQSSTLGEPSGSPITATAFDRREELVWIGTHTVIVLLKL